MSSEINNKLSDINSYIDKLEGQVKKGTVINTIIYALVAIIFLAYAAIIPSTVKAITSPEEGPATLVSVLEDTLPSNDTLLQSALDETPMWVENSLDNIWDLIPSIEGMFIEGMSGMTAELVNSIERDSAPILKDFLSQKIVEIQKDIPDIKSPEGKEAFNEAVREFVRVNLQQVIVDARGSFLEAHKSFKKYNLSERELSPKEITEKKVILTFIRLNEDEEYKNQLTDAFFKGFEGFYQQFTVE